MVSLDVGHSMELGETSARFAASDPGVDARRVRFASIDGLDRADLPLACDVWRDDLFRAPWVERDVMRLAILFTRYICRPDPSMILLRELERTCQLSRADVSRVLTIMVGFGAVDSFALDRDDVRAFLHLSMLQRLRVLEAKQRFQELRMA
jgi:hypothetical protein